MFISCYALTTVPLFNTVRVTNMTSMFQNCYNLKIIPVFDTRIVNTTTNIFSNCFSLTNATMSGLSATTSYAATNISYSALSAIFLNLGLGTSRTITITNALGASQPLSAVRTCTTTVSSTTISSTSVAGLLTGMQVIGTGTPLTTGKAVTLTDVTNLVTLANHGLENGDAVSFSVITTTTGIAINHIYYVINKTASTFQLAVSVGGSAINLVTNGSGTIRYMSRITLINPATRIITMNRPMATAATNTVLTFRMTHTGLATMKGWTVTG